MKKKFSNSFAKSLPKSCAIDCLDGNTSPDIYCKFSEMPPPATRLSVLQQASLLRSLASFHFFNSAHLLSVNPVNSIEHRDSTLPGFTICRPLPPAWSQASNVAAAHIRHGNLEVMQWLAFSAMVMGNMGLFMPYFGVRESISSQFLIGIGNMAFPIFCFVFAWRLSHMLWSNARHNFIGNFLHLFLCAVFGAIAWGASGIKIDQAHAAGVSDIVVNVVVIYIGTMATVLLLQEDRGWTVPLGLRVVFAALISCWIGEHNELAMAGLVLPLSIYGYLRFNDNGARNTALAALAAMTLSMPMHTAVLALPVIYIIHESRISVKKLFSGVFYFLYPLQIIVLTLLTTVISV